MSAGVQMTSKKWGVAKSAEENRMNRFEGEPYRGSVRDVGAVSDHAGSAVPEPLFVVMLIITQELITWLPKLRASDISN